MPNLTTSVALCTYNGEKFLSQQLDSIAAQTRVPDEIVLCDDGSNDGTIELARKHERSLPLRIVSNSRRLGVTENFSNAIAECSGDVIFLSDQDDVWDSRKVENILEIFASEDGPGLVFSDASLIDERAHQLGGSLWQVNRFTARRKERFEHGNAFVHLLRSNIVTGATAAFRSEFKSAILPIPPDWIHDYWIATLMAAISTIHCEPTQLTLYRIHSAQQIGIHQNALDKLRSLMFRKIDLDVEQEKHYELKRRISSYEGRQAFSPDVISLIEAKLAHLQVRKEIALHAGSLSRKLVKEILSGNYARYSYGLIDVVTDIYLGLRARK